MNYHCNFSNFLTLCCAPHTLLVMRPWFSIIALVCLPPGFPGGSDGKESTCNATDLGLILGWEDPLEKGMATHSSNLAWRIPWSEDPGGLQFMESQRIGYD